MEPLDELLAELGAGESEPGCLTIDPARARHLLARYARPDRYEYVLELVQSAIAGGTQGVQVVCSASEVRVYYDGPPERAHLARGLLLAEALSPVETTAGHPLVVRRRLRRPSLRDLGRSLREALSRPSRLARPMGFPEERLLHARCAFAPVPVVVNNRPVNQYFYGGPTRRNQTLDLQPSPEMSGSTLIMAETAGPDCIPGLSRAWGQNFLFLEPDGETPLSRPPVTLPAITVCGSPALACQAVMQRTPGFSSLGFVHHGVLVERMQVSGLTHRWVLASARGLGFDLAGRIVRDERFEARLQWLRRASQLTPVIVPPG